MTRAPIPHWESSSKQWDDLRAGEGLTHWGQHVAPLDRILLPWNTGMICYHYPRSGGANLEIGTVDECPAIEGFGFREVTPQCENNRMKAVIF